MASVINDPQGRKRIIFARPHGHGRRSIPLGKCSDKKAREFCGRIEAIVADLIRGDSHAPDLSRWIGERSDAMHGRLARVGLVKPREAAGEPALGAFIDDYLRRRPKLKPNTIKNLKQTRRWLVECYG